MISFEKNKEHLEGCLRDHRGVTLLELMVSVALFSVTIIMAAQIFQMVINGQRDAVASQDLQENVRYALEAMDKEVRMAQKETRMVGFCSAYNKIFVVAASSTTGWDELTFLNYRGDCVKYFLRGNRLVIRRTPLGGTTVEGYVTPSKLRLDKLRFLLMDSSPSNQAMINMKFRVEATTQAGFKQKLDLETTISSRYYE